MHVLIISNKYPPDVVGGAELVASSLARSLLEASCDVTVLTTRATPGEKERAETDGVAVHRVWTGTDFLPRPGIPWWRHVVHQGHAHVLDLHNRRAARAIHALVDTVQPDVVHTHNLYGLSPSVWSAADRRGIPIVHTAHDAYLLCPRGTLLHASGRPCKGGTLLCRLYRAWYVRAARKVAAFCCPSEHYLDLHRTAGIRARAYHLVRNGIEGVPREAPQKTPPVDRPLRALYLGQLESHKGIDTLLRAAETATDCTLAIAGTGRLAPRVEAVAGRCEAITYHGFVTGPAKQRLLADADVLVLPSVWPENCPLSIAEGFAHALPAVVTDLGGQAELVDDGQTGRVFSPGDADGLAGILCDLAAEPAQLSAMRQAAFEASRTFALDRMTRAYLEVYREAGAPAG